MFTVSPQITQKSVSGKRCYIPAAGPPARSQGPSRWSRRPAARTRILDGSERSSKVPEASSLNPGFSGKTSAFQALQNER